MIFLLADDDTRSRESVKRFLLKNIPNHHTFIEASDGTAAVALYERSVDWVLMDIEMKPMDGLDALRAIKTSHPDAKIVMLTFYDDIRYRKAAQEAGAVAYVVKDHLDALREILTPIGKRGS